MGFITECVLIFLTRYYSLDLILLEVWCLDLFEMLIASKYHLASKAVADEAHCEVILDWRDANLADHDTSEES